MVLSVQAAHTFVRGAANSRSTTTFLFALSTSKLKTRFFIPRFLSFTDILCSPMNRITRTARVNGSPLLSNGVSFDHLPRAGSIKETDQLQIYKKPIGCTKKIVKDDKNPGKTCRRYIVFE